MKWYASKCGLFTSKTYFTIIFNNIILRLNAKSPINALLNIY